MGESEDILDNAEEEAHLRDQYEDVMFERHYDTARNYLKAQNLDQALAEVDKALNYRPTSEEALNLRRDILRLRGDRAGEVGTVVQDQWEAYKVKLDEQKVTVRRYLGQAEDAMDAQNYEDARRAYESALFIVSTGKISPLGGDAELAELGSKAEAGLKELDSIEAESRAEQERRDTEQALRDVAEQEEKALMEARDRRARLLSMAIDHFNQENFESAESFAQQVLNEEPDNTVAADIVDNSRRARHSMADERYMRDLKESFRRWQVEIERTKVPSSKILQWPSQRFWDRISQVRAMQKSTGAESTMTPEEAAVANTLKSRTIDLPFENTPFRQVVDYLTAASGVNFVIDARAKDDLEAAEITLTANGVTVKDALDLVMMQASAEGEVRYEITGNIVRFIKKEHMKKNMVLRIHPVADLTLGLTDFIPPQITQIGVDEDSETPLFGGQAEEAPQPYGTIEELMELVRGSVRPMMWEEEGGNINAQGKNLVVYAPPGVQGEVAQFLDDLRAFSGIVITIESRFLSVTDGFLRDVGVDFRGLGGTNGGPLAVLDDVTSGLDDNASAGIDNGGPGVNAGGAALAPSSGLFFNDGSDGDFRGRSENIFTNPLGQMLSALGGGTFAVTFLDDFAFSAIVRATEKSVQVRELTAPSLTVYNTQRANLTVVNQISFVQDFDVEVAQTAFIADPVIGVIQDGLTLDVRPTVSNDRQYITMELRPTVANLITPIATFQTLLGASIALGASQNPVTIQLPEIRLRVAESTVRIPDRGSILLGGLKDINIEDKKSTTPILGSLPIINFLFKRQGKSEEIEHLMILVTATITDLQEEAERVLGQ
jgi:general secretion pathway protein D